MYMMASFDCRSKAIRKTLKGYFSIWDFKRSNPHYIVELDNNEQETL